MTRWYEDALNSAHVERLRANLADGGRVLVFLGAGLSFGSALRPAGRGSTTNIGEPILVDHARRRCRPYEDPYYDPNWGPPFRHIPVPRDRHGR